MGVFSFNLNMQLPVTLQNGNEVNRETLPPQAASSLCGSTKHNGLVTTALCEYSRNLNNGIPSFWSQMIVQWRSEIRTSLDFEWSKRGWVANVPDKWLHILSKI